jgi:hypothetical protein
MRCKGTELALGTGRAVADNNVDVRLVGVGVHDSPATCLGVCERVALDTPKLDFTHAANGRGSRPEALLRRGCVARHPRREKPLRSAGFLLDARFS